MPTYTDAPKAAKPARSCRWISPNPLDLFAAGWSAWLEVTVGGVSETYTVCPRIDGDRVVSWTVGRMRGEEYVEYVLPADLAHCSCPSAHYRPGQSCRHRDMLRAAFAALGYRP